MIAELGADWAGRFRQLRAAVGRLGVAGTGASRGGARRPSLGLQAAVSGHELGRGGRPQPAQSGVRPARAHESGDRHGRNLKEVSARLREELDYELEAKHMALYASIFADEPRIRVPEVLPELSTRRLLTMTWLEGRRLLDYKTAPLEDRNEIARAMFKAWWFPFSHYGVIHGDPHLGNYTVFDVAGSASRRALGKPAGINLLDYGCIRTFPTKFVQGVIDLYTGLKTGRRDLVVHAYETWGFTGLSSELIDVLNIWAQFIYGPLLDDREAGDRRRHHARPIRTQGSLHGAQGAQGEGARAGAARVRVHGPGCDRLGRRIPAPGGASQLARHLQRDHRGLHDGRGGCATEGCVRGRGRSLAGGIMRLMSRTCAIACWPCLAQGWACAGAGRCAQARAGASRGPGHHHRADRRRRHQLQQPAGRPEGRLQERLPCLGGDHLADRRRHQRRSQLLQPGNGRHRSQ
jgi:hypothetical protein